MKNLTEYIAEAFKFDSVRMMGLDRITAASGPGDVIVADFVDGKSKLDVLTLYFGSEGYIHVLREENSGKVNFKFLYTKNAGIPDNWDDASLLEDADVKVPKYKLPKIIYSFIENNLKEIVK